MFFVNYTFSSMKCQHKILWEVTLQINKLRTLRSNIMLIATALIWGTAFVAQDSAGAKFGGGTFTITFARFIMGAIVTLPLFLFLTKGADKTDKTAYNNGIKLSLKAGVLSGIALFAAAALQQYGIILGTNSGKAGFITVMYVVLVPICGLLFKRKVGALSWIAVIIAPVGLYLLCLSSGSFDFRTSDLVVLASAFAYTVQILLVDHFCPKCNGVLMSIVQFAVVAVLSGIIMFASEFEYFLRIPEIGLELLYLGIMSCGVAYTLQILGQKHTNPTVASLLMSLESVFALLFGSILLSQIPTRRELIGCAIIFTAVILAQLPSPKFKPKEKRK